MQTAQTEHDAAPVLNRGCRWLDTMMSSHQAADVVLAPVWSTSVWTVLLIIALPAFQIISREAENLGGCGSCAAAA